MTTAQTATIRVERLFPHPPATVWRALTEPELLARWWAPGDITPVVGHRFTLDMRGFGPQPCEVLEVVPAERFVYRFGPGWTLTWTLHAQDGGTLLRLAHGDFDLSDPRARFAFENMGKGWEGAVLPRLAELLDGGIG
ncbi:MAG: SRPBCC domain-containing protein [Alphaproteobacteria bacterium]|nr:SRPBCC domain-containing protein [Alphaproteobacteria bacterium]